VGDAKANAGIASQGRFSVRAISESQFIRAQTSVALEYLAQDPAREDESCSIPSQFKSTLTLPFVI